MKSLLFNKFKPFKIVLIQNLILLHINSDSCSPSKNVEPNIFFWTIKFSI